VVVVGWAVWRRTGALRTTLPGLTVAHCWAGRRTVPFFQASVILAHDLTGRRSLPPPPFLHALAGCRSLDHSPLFQALAVECAWSLPLPRRLAAVMWACAASAGSAMGPATSRAPRPTASDNARRTGRLTLRSLIAVSKGSRGRQQSPKPIGPRAAAPTCTSTLGDRSRRATFGASRQARLYYSIGPDRSDHGSVMDFTECRRNACHRPSSSCVLAIIHQAGSATSRILGLAAPAAF
jgi:hypothetical protein